MPMPMMPMPTDWKATGALGGLYGGMQAQYQTDAMRDATRQAELDYALKQHDLHQKLLDDPVREAQRTAEITKANEFNTLSPTRIEGAQTDLSDKKWTLEEKRRISQTAQQAEFFAGLPDALDSAKAGGPAAQKAVWDEANAKGKPLGINIGDEWNMDNEVRLRSNAQKALQSLSHLREMAKVAAQGDIQKTIARENAGSAEYIQAMKNIHSTNEGAADRENRLEIARIGADSRLASAEARASSPKAMNMGQYRVYLLQKVNEGTATVEELRQLAEMKNLDLAKIMAGDPAAQLNSLKNDPAAYSARVQAVGEAILAAPSGGGATTPNSGWSGKIKQ